MQSLTLSQSGPTSLRRLAPAVALALAAMLSVQTGAAVSTWLFDRIGPTGTAWLRLYWAAVILLLIARPGLRGRSRADWLTVLVLGTVSGMMTVCYFEAIHRIPLGTATALEFLGPLTVAMVGLRQRLDLIWPVAAAGGVLALTNPVTADLHPVGVLFALAAGTGWGLYIVFTQRVGDRFAGLQGLALSMATAALVTSFTPGALHAIPRIDLRALLVAGLAALLLPILPYAFEMVSLRTLTTASFGTLMSLEPAMGTLVGAILLSQRPTLVQLLGIGLVTLAGVGAALRGGRPQPPPQQAPQEA